MSAQESKHKDPQYTQQEKRERVMLALTAFGIIFAFFIGIRQVNLMGTQNDIIKEQARQGEALLDHTQSRDSIQAGQTAIIDSIRNAQGESLKVFSKRMADANDISAKTFQRNVQISEHSLDATRAHLVILSVKIDSSIYFSRIYVRKGEVLYLHKGRVTYRSGKPMKAENDTLITYDSTYFYGVRFVIQNQGGMPAKRIKLSIWVAQCALGYFPDSLGFRDCGVGWGGRRNDAVKIDYVKAGDTIQPFIPLSPTFDSATKGHILRAIRHQVRNDDSDKFKSSGFLMAGFIHYDASGRCLSLQYAKEYLANERRFNDWGVYAGVLGAPEFTRTFVENCPEDAPTAHAKNGKGAK